MQTGSPWPMHKDFAILLLVNDGCYLLRLVLLLPVPELLHLKQRMQNYLLQTETRLFGLFGRVKFMRVISYNNLNVHLMFSRHCFISNMLEKIQTKELNKLNKNNLWGWIRIQKFAISDNAWNTLFKAISSRTQKWYRSSRWVIVNTLYAVVEYVILPSFLPVPSILSPGTSSLFPCTSWFPVCFSSCIFFLRRRFFFRAADTVR